MTSNKKLTLYDCIAKDFPIRYMDYKGYYVPDSYPSIADAIENFEIRDDDVWLCGFSKTGSTWSSEMIWCIGNDCDYEAAKTPLPLRFPYVDRNGSTSMGWAVLNSPTKKFPEFMSKALESAENMPSPRFLKTHLPFHLLPKKLRTGETKAKIIYVMRDPKDTCISYYHHSRMMEAYTSTFENFCELFLQDQVLLAPFWENIIGYWKIKDQREILFIKFEDMKADLAKVIEKVAKFLNKKMTQEQVAKLMQHLSFENTKANPAVNKKDLVNFINKHKLFGDSFVCEGEFVRKGEAGQYKARMTPEMIQRFGEWSTEKLKDYPDLHALFF